MRTLLCLLLTRKRSSGVLIHGFGRRLEPRYVVGARALDQ